MGNVVNFPANDSLRSFVAGLGDPARDKMATAYYGHQLLDDGQLLNSYRSTWLARKIVDIPADDAIRKGRNWQASNDQIEAIEAEEKRLGFWRKLREVQVKARLWGGAAIYIGTGDSDPSKPLDPERIASGGLKYLTVLSRREIIAGQVDQDALSPTYGWPVDYQVTGSTQFATIHPSRLAIFVGSPHPEQSTVGGPNKGWGDSVLESVFSAIKNADATAANIASLVFEANVDVFGVPDLMANLADPSYAQRLLDRFTLAATAKGINKALVRDVAEEYDRKQVSFATLPDVMQSFLQQVSGAADIPVTRLLGQSPAGMSATGESDLRNYYDRISSMQELVITPAIDTLDECLIRSALGGRPKEVNYRWASLWQLSDKEKAEIFKMKADAARALVGTSTGQEIITREAVSDALINDFIEDGSLPGLEAAIEEYGKLSEQEPSEEEIVAAAAQAELSRQPAGQRATDAEPRTLYVRRNVVNAAEIIAWAKGQGFQTTLPAEDLHVTITYSRSPVDWMKMGSAWDDEVKIPRGGARLVEKFGEARVLLFNSNMLRWRHDEMVEAGASWDHPEYQPHITISYDPDSPDLSEIEPYQGEIVLGPELFEEVNEGWRAGIEEA